MAQQLYEHALTLDKLEQPNEYFKCLIRAADLDYLPAEELLLNEYVLYHDTSIEYNTDFVDFLKQGLQQNWVYSIGYLGTIAAIHGHVAQAIEYYKQILPAGKYLTYYNLVTTYCALGKHEEAKLIAHQMNNLDFRDFLLTHFYQINYQIEVTETIYRRLLSLENIGWSRIDILYNYTRMLNNIRRYPEVISNLVELQAAGHVAALTLLARKYQQGQGVPQDVERALELYEQAVRYGDARAMAALAPIYLSKGRIDQAFELLNVGARKKDVECVSQLANYYEQGLYVEKDVKRAKQILKAGIKPEFRTVVHIRLLNIYHREKNYTGVLKYHIDPTCSLLLRVIDDYGYDSKIVHRLNQLDLIEKRHVPLAIRIIQACYPSWQELRVNFFLLWLDDSSSFHVLPIELIQLIADII